MARADQLEEGVFLPDAEIDLPKETDSSYGDQVTKLNELLIREDFFEERSDLETRLDATLVEDRRGEVSSRHCLRWGSLLRYLNRLGLSF